MNNTSNNLNILDEKVITLMEAANILGMKYHTARQRILNEKRVRYFDYNKNIKVVESDIKQYKRNAYIKPENKPNNKIIDIDTAGLKTITIKEAAEILKIGYFPTYDRVKSKQEIGYFDYNGKISVVEQDVYDYKINHQH